MRQLSGGTRSKQFQIESCDETVQKYAEIYSATGGHYQRLLIQPLARPADLRPKLWRRGARPVARQPILPETSGSNGIMKRIALNTTAVSNVNDVLGLFAGPINSHSGIVRRWTREQS